MISKNKELIGHFGVVKETRFNRKVGKLNYVLGE